MPEKTAPSIALIGLGPRGISTLERLIAQLNNQETTAHPLTLHLIDPAQHGGGKIWDIHQPKSLCMNTFAHGMTLFSEPGATVTAPIVQGPTIYEWLRILLDDTTDIAESKLEYVRKHSIDGTIFERFSKAELEEIGPASYPPRAVYGYYLQWYFQSILRDLPEWVTVHRHHERVISITPVESHDIITLESGAEITARATIAVTGWQRQGHSKQEEWIAQNLQTHPNLRWIAADSPIDQDIAGIRPQEKVLVRGLGMGLFDVLALTTVDRGGKFLQDDSACGLRYEPSGQEPQFFVSSRRGYPFLPQSKEPNLPRPAAIPRLTKVVAELSSRTGKNSIDYDVEVWPSVARDAYHAYVSTLARVEPDALKAPLDTIVAAIDAAHVDAHAVFHGLTSLDDVISSFTTKNFSLLRWINLLPYSFADAQALTAYITARMQEDLSEALLACDSPTRAALWSLGWSRKPTQVLGAEGRYTLESRHNTFDLAIALGQMACSGPPAFRTQQLLALVDAGIVQFIGGNPLLDTDDTTGQWTMSSTNSGGIRYQGTTLLDAWVHKPDIRKPAADAMMRGLVESGRIHSFGQNNANGILVPAASPAQDHHTRRVFNSDGRLDPRLHVVGIPAHDQYPDTTISPPIPGTDPWFIQETDRAAVSAAAVAFAS